MDIEISAFKTAIVYKADGENYLIKIEMSEFVEPFDSERYLFLLEANDTSVHDFYPLIILSDGETIKSKEYKLTLLKDKDQKSALLIDGAYYKAFNVSKDDFLNVLDNAGRQASFVQKITYNTKNIELLNARKLIESAIWVKVKYNNQEGCIIQNTGL